MSSWLKTKCITEEKLLLKLSPKKSLRKDMERLTERQNVFNGEFPKRNLSTKEPQPRESNRRQTKRRIIPNKRFTK
jgi:hypothetical protein